MKKRLGKGNFNKGNFGQSSTLITDHELERKVLDHFLNGTPMFDNEREKGENKPPFKRKNSERKKIIRKFKGKKEVKKDLNDLYKSTYNKVQMR